MTQTTARIKQDGKNFEIIVDLNSALNFKRGLSSAMNFLDVETIFTDSKKGFKASEKDLTSAFGTTDVSSVAAKIVRNGEILLTQEHRDEEKDKKIKQAIDFIRINAVDPKTGNPYTPEKIKTALDEAGINIKNLPIEQQTKEITEKLSRILPLKFATKRIKVIVPAIHTGRAYGIFSQYKESENWLGNGDLEVTLNIPSGFLMEFYDKLNSITHGAALTEEIKEK